MTETPNNTNIGNDRLKELVAMGFSIIMQLPLTIRTFHAFSSFDQTCPPNTLGNLFDMLVRLTWFYFLFKFFLLVCFCLNYCKCCKYSCRCSRSIYCKSCDEITPLRTVVVLDILFCFFGAIYILTFKVTPTPASDAFTLIELGFINSYDIASFFVGCGLMYANTIKFQTTDESPRTSPETNPRVNPDENSGTLPATGATDLQLSDPDQDSSQEEDLGQPESEDEIENVSLFSQGSIDIPHDSPQSSSVIDDHQGQIQYESYLCGIINWVSSHWNFVAGIICILFLFGTVPVFLLKDIEVIVFEAPNCIPVYKGMIHTVSNVSTVFCNTSVTFYRGDHSIVCNDGKEACNESFRVHRIIIAGTCDVVNLKANNPHKDQIPSTPVPPTCPTPSPTTKRPTRIPTKSPSKSPKTSSPIQPTFNRTGQSFSPTDTPTSDSTEPTPSPIDPTKSPECQTSSPQHCPSCDDNYKKGHGDGIGEGIGIGIGVGIGICSLGGILIWLFKRRCCSGNENV